MAPSVEECEKMIETARRTGKNLMIGQCLRFAGQYDTIKKIVSSGEYGKAYSAFFFRGGGTPLWSYENWLLKREKGGGALFDQHVHDVDAVNHIFGMPKAVTTSSVCPKLLPPTAIPYSPKVHTIAVPLTISMRI